MYLILGATGNVGSRVATELAQQHLAVRAISRNPQTAHLPAGVEVVRADLADPAGLDGALAGVEVVFFMMPLAQPDIAQIAERICAAVQRVVFLSSASVREGFDPNDFLAVAHKRVEDAIEASGARWTFLRPGYFATNTLLWWSRQLAVGDTVRWPYPKARLAPIDPADVASVAVRALTDEAHTGKRYVLTGPDLVTFEDQARIIGEVTKRAIRLQEISDAEAIEMFAPVPQAVTERILDGFRSAVTEPPPPTGTVSAVLGRPARSFRTWAAANAGAFKRS